MCSLGVGVSFVSANSNGCFGAARMTASVELRPSMIRPAQKRPLRSLLTTAGGTRQGTDPAGNSSPLSRAPAVLTEHYFSGSK
jgi:hypothetical protein